MKIIILLILLSGASGLAQSKAYKPMPSISYEAYADLIDKLLRRPPLLSEHRLPPGYRIGRCRFEVNGQTLIAGACAYTVTEEGGIAFDGPRQVYIGIDYPMPEVYAEAISTDYSVEVEHERMDDGSIGPGWEAIWNGDIGSTHMHSRLGPVIRNGDCYSNAETAICVWTE